MKTLICKFLRGVCITAYTTRPDTEEWLEWQPPIFLQILSSFKALGHKGRFTSVESVYQAPNNLSTSGEIENVEKNCRK